MKEIELHGKVAAGRVAMIDDEDLDLVGQYRWTCYEKKLGPGRRNLGPYAWTRPYVRKSDRPVQIVIQMHCLILGVNHVDHIDHNGLNNQRSNLRPATVAQNNHNQRPRLTGSSRYKGVTWHKKLSKWQAGIKVDGRFFHLGVFASEEEAALAYDAAALDAYGERAYLNGGSA